MLLSLISYLVIGAVVGAIATKIVDLRGDSPLLGVGAALAGAVLLGMIYRFASGNVELWSLLGLGLAVVGAAVGVTIFHLVRSRSISRDRQTVRSSY